MSDDKGIKFVYSACARQRPCQKYIIYPITSVAEWSDALVFNMPEMAVFLSMIDNINFLNKTLKNLILK